MKILMIILRVLCYLGLAIMLFGAASLFLPFILDLCSYISGGTVKCTDPLYHWFFETGFAIVMVGIFTGVPIALAIGGVVFSVVDFVRWLDR